MVNIDRRLAVKRPLVSTHVAHILVCLEYTRVECELTTDEAILRSSTISMS